MDLHFENIARSSESLSSQSLLSRIEMPDERAGVIHISKHCNPTGGSISSCELEGIWTQLENGHLTNGISYSLLSPELFLPCNSFQVLTNALTDYAYLKGVQGMWPSERDVENSGQSSTIISHHLCYCFRIWSFVITFKAGVVTSEKYPGSPSDS